jgi:hypothetical protein
VLVAQSMGAVTALAACGRLAVRRFVLNDAMIARTSTRSASPTH